MYYDLLVNIFSFDKKRKTYHLVLNHKYKNNIFYEFLMTLYNDILAITDLLYDSGIL